MKTVYYVPPTFVKLTAGRPLATSNPTKVCTLLSIARQSPPHTPAVHQRLNNLDMHAFALSQVPLLPASLKATCMRTEPKAGWPRSSPCWGWVWRVFAQDVSPADRQRPAGSEGDELPMAGRHTVEASPAPGTCVWLCRGCMDRRTYST